MTFIGLMRHLKGHCCVHYPGNKAIIETCGLVKRRAIAVCCQTIHVGPFCVET